MGGQAPTRVGTSTRGSNTDGIDPNGAGFYVHDCEINNDDDSIAVKPADGSTKTGCSKDMLFENLVLTGFGASIGSVPPHASVNCVRNITFRNISMPGTGKGIYIKSNPSCDRKGSSSLIEGITYENVTIDQPYWWPIWIGPQQQHEPGSALGEKCALDYPINKHCPTQGCATFANITLKDVLITDPLLSPGVVLGNATRPMENVVFDNVRVRYDPAKSTLRGRFPFGRKYECESAKVVSVGGTSPVPKCG